MRDIPADIDDDSDDITKWSTQHLVDREQILYDLEIDGVDTWFERDQILWELNKRHFR